MSEQPTETKCPKCGVAMLNIAYDYKRCESCGMDWDGDTARRLTVALDLLRATEAAISLKDAARAKGAQP